MLYLLCMIWYDAHVGAFKAASQAHWIKFVIWNLHSVGNSVKLFIMVSALFLHLFVSEILLELIAFVLNDFFLSIRFSFLFNLLLQTLNILLFSFVFMHLFERFFLFLNFLLNDLLFYQFLLSYFLLIFKFTFFLRRSCDWFSSSWTFSIHELWRQKWSWLYFKIWIFIILKILSRSYF